jgi:uncharacterized protein YqfB (UPF0267 family)
MSGNVNEMKEGLTAIEKDGKILLTEVQTKEQELKNLESKIQASKDLKNKKLELERSESLLQQLEIIDIKPIDVTKLESEHSENINKLSKMKTSLEMSKLTGLKEMQLRQEQLNQELTKLNELIKEIIPNMLTLNVKNVTLSKDGIHYQGLPLSRHGDSLKLRICTAILKDLFPTSNLFCMDRSECIDQDELAKYVNYYSGLSDPYQYFMSVVGDTKLSQSSKIKTFKVEGFKIA